jgi:hypothetical protein
VSAPILRDSTGSRPTIAGVTYCGYHSCDGRCGLPAGYVDTPDRRRLYLRGSMTAAGPIMQPCTPHRDGVTVDLRTVLDDETIGRLLKGWWL